MSKNSQNSIESPLTSDINERGSRYVPIPYGKYLELTRVGVKIPFCIFDKNIVKLCKILKKIENYFTLKSVQITGGIRKIKRTRINRKKQYIIVPRFGSFEILNESFKLRHYCIKSQLPSGDECLAKFTGKLTTNQQVITEYLLKNIYNKQRLIRGSAGCILNLEAGQGKSYIAAYLFGVFKRKTAIILHSSSLLEQWKTLLTVCYPNIAIGEYHSKKKTDGDIILMIVNSVAKSKEFVDTVGKRKNKVIITRTPGEYFDRFGFIVYDECHLYANNFAAKAFKRASAPYMLGLSATPNDNIDKFDKLVWWEIGQVIDAARIPGFKSTESNFTATIHRIMYYGSGEYTKLLLNPGTGMVSTTLTIGQLCNDKHRMKLIINCICECAEDPARYIYVFADRRDYLERIREEYIKHQKQSTNNDTSALMTNDDEYVRIVGGSTTKDLKHAELNARIIFTTYQYMGTGKSIVKMNALILATPRKSKMAQYIKRIFRLGSDESIDRVVYDIVDMKTTLSNQWSKRKKFYKSENYKIIEKKIKFNDDELN